MAQGSEKSKYLDAKYFEQGSNECESWWIVYMVGIL